ncbi:beta-1,3-galactosyltransferase 5-like isoform X2 [Lineus longissimus]
MGSVVFLILFIGTQTKGWSPRYPIHTNSIPASEEKPLNIHPMQNSSRKQPKIPAFVAVSTAAAAEYRRTTSVTSPKHAQGDPISKEMAPMVPKKVVVVQKLWTPPENFDTKVNTANDSSIAFVLNNEMRCQGELSKYLSLFIYVESAVDDFDRRRTWRSKLSFFQTAGDNKVTFMFIVALPKDNLTQAKVVIESKLHGDILQLNYTDVYTALVLKTVGGMKWAIKYCANAQFILKTDVDVFVNVHSIFDYLNDLKHVEKEFLYGGYVQWLVAPVRKGKGGPQKWAVSEAEYPYANYPSYALGFGILMSKKSVVRFLAGAPYVKYFVFEDVYIGMLANATNVTATAIPGFVPHDGSKIAKKFDFCSSKAHNVVHNFQTPKQFAFFWDNFERFMRYGYKC